MSQSRRNRGVGGGKSGCLRSRGEKRRGDEKAMMENGKNLEEKERRRRKLYIFFAIRSNVLTMLS